MFLIDLQVDIQKVIQTYKNKKIKKQSNEGAGPNMKYIRPPIMLKKIDKEIIINNAINCEKPISINI